MGGAVAAQEGLSGTPWCVPALGTPSRVRGRPAGPLLGPPGASPPPCAGQVAARWPRGRCGSSPRGACAWGAWGGRAGATSPGLSTSHRRRSRCRLRAGLSGSPARGAWPVRGPGSSRSGVAGRAWKARRRPGPRPGESWASTRGARGAARRRRRPGAPPPPRRRRPGRLARRSRSPGSNRGGAGGPGGPRPRARRTPAIAPRRGDTAPWGTRSGPGPGSAAPSRASGCFRGLPWEAAPRPGARPRGPGTSAGRWGPFGPAAPRAAAAAGDPSRRPYGSRGNRTRAAGEWRGSGGAGGVPAAECWYQMLRGLGFHLRNYCPTRKLKQRKSKKKIQQNQPEGDGRRHRGREGGERRKIQRTGEEGGRGGHTGRSNGKKGKKQQPQVGGGGGGDKEEGE